MMAVVIKRMVADRRYGLRREKRRRRMVILGRQTGQLLPRSGKGLPQRAQWEDRAGSGMILIDDLFLRY